jgi:hypothetical protein
MATADGETGHERSHEGGPRRRPVEPSNPAEPTVLASGFPAPAEWGPVLGPGGEDLGDGVVPVDACEPPDAPRSQDTGTRLHRRGRRRVVLPSRGTVLAAGAAAGVIGLAVLLVTALFSFEGSPPPPPVRIQIATASISEEASSSVAEAVSASAKLEATVDRSSKRQRAIAVRNRELSRRRARERRRAHAPASSSATRQVATMPSTTPSPTPQARPSAPAREAWSGVSAAEREFTPGPWNLG